MLKLCMEIHQAIAIGGTMPLWSMGLLQQNHLIVDMH
jgi:hypothetical protein